MGCAESSSARCAPALRSRLTRSRWRRRFFACWRACMFPSCSACHPAMWPRTTSHCRSAFQRCYLPARPAYGCRWSRRHSWPATRACQQLARRSPTASEFIRTAMKARSIHLIGICGTAMASLAGMLKLRGLDVRGSDSAAYPPMSTFLESLGIRVMQPFSEQNLEPAPDLVVVGNAISRGNPELEYLLDRRIPFVSMPQVIHDEFIRGRNSLVIAGTHGKTTTTSMAAWIFEFAGRKPSFLVGGIAENFGSSFAVTDGAEFIIEGDEYDTAFFDKGPKFLHYFPDAVILTSVEFDHADIYKDLDAVETSFKRLVNLVPRRGRIVAFDSGESIVRCLARAFCPVERYGASGSA